MVIIHYNKKNYKYDDNNKIMIYNKKWLNNSTTLIFGNEFNKYVKIPKTIKFLKFGNNFNQKIHIPNGLCSLEFGYYFNKYINIPNSVENLIFGDNFNSFIY